MALVVIVGLCLVTIVADVFLKEASGQTAPFRSGTFYLGLLAYSSTAFGWLFVMRYLKFATIGVVYSVATLLLMTVFGVLCFKESLNWQETAGVGFALVSIFLLGKFL